MSESPAPARVSNVDAATAIARHRGGTPIIDVREDDEWRAGHIPGAMHLSVADLTPDSVPSRGPVLVICRSGSRSAKATQTLAAAGLEVGNVVGGMTAWAANGGSMEADTGRAPIIA